jgi:hypothetical protein
VAIGEPVIAHGVNSIYAAEEHTLICRDRSLIASPHKLQRPL